MKKKQSQPKEIKKDDEKIAVAARVDKDAFDNGMAIANKFEWSLSKVINKALKVVTADQISK